MHVPTIDVTPSFADETRWIAKREWADGLLIRLESARLGIVRVKLKELRAEIERVDQLNECGPLMLS